MPNLQQKQNFIDLSLTISYILKPTLPPIPQMIQKSL